MHKRIATVVALGLLATACASPAPSSAPTGSPGALEIEVAQFTKLGGCGDTIFWAARADGTGAITVQWDGAASAAWANGAFSATEQLPNAEITVSVVEGHGLDSYYCNDVLGPGQGPTSTVEAASGTVEIAVHADPQGFKPAGHADLRLTDISFHVNLGSGETWHLNGLVIENVAVGWLAG